jgi:hypothetical protein
LLFKPLRPGCVSGAIVRTRNSPAKPKRKVKPAPPRRNVIPDSIRDPDLLPRACRKDNFKRHTPGGLHVSAPAAEWVDCRTTDWIPGQARDDGKRNGNPHQLASHSFIRLDPYMLPCASLKGEISNNGMPFHSVIPDSIRDPDNWAGISPSRTWTRHPCPAHCRVDWNGKGAGLVPAPCCLSLLPRTPNFGPRLRRYFSQPNGSSTAPEPVIRAPGLSTMRTVLACSPFSPCWAA